MKISNSIKFNPKLVGQLFPSITGILLTVFGGAVLIGLALDIFHLKTLHSYLGPITANTAFAFLLIGLSLLIPLLSASLSALRFSILSILLYGAIGLFTLGEYFFSLNLGFDQWLLHYDATGSIDNSALYKMTPDLASCLLLLSGAQLLALRRKKNIMSLWPKTILGATALAIALTTLLSNYAESIWAFGLWELPVMSNLLATIISF